ncbi:MAG: folylpolyglutamate synthase/dihydrofolate synthase family protein [Bacteroidales bacterium]
MVRNNDKYKKLVEELYNQTPSFQVVGGKAYHPGMKCMHDFDDILGHPHKNYRIIHVAGTNGKGSVSHMLASVLAAAGYKVGLYTSPHLVDFRERFRIVESKADANMVNYRYVSKETVVAFLEKFSDFIKNNNPSFFEITTAMAFEFFKEEKVDIAVVEVGLGGRLDSTNIVNPDLSVITSIGLDHCDLLGNTLEEIAKEKGGIIKSRVPLVVGNVNSQVRKVFEDISKERNTTSIFVNDAVKDQVFKELKQSLKIDFNNILSQMDLKGEYQLWNIQTVLCVLFSQPVKSWLDNKLKESERLTTIKTAICNSAKWTGLRGRWEILSNKPLIICDIAHNPHGLEPVIKQLKETYEKKIDECGGSSKLLMIFGMVADKDIDTVGHLLPKNAYYFFTNAKGTRALKSIKLQQRLSGDDLKGEISDSVEDALKNAIKILTPKDILYIGGSSYVVAEAIELIGNNN